jgi:fermentation-respiration switch protein FrsA (DUF1100 family)
MTTPNGMRLQPMSTATVTGTVPISTAVPSLVPTRTLTVTPTLAASPTPSLTATSQIQPTPTLTPTVTAALNISSVPKYTLSLDAKSLSIESLRGRPYGGGQIKITRVLSTYDEFRRVLFEYPSDGLRITGMMNIPRGSGPFPVVILDHGYFKPAEYKTGDGTSRAADNFARNGYLTLASDYRCYGGSQCGPNPLYVGYAVDVLNLIGSLASLPNADTARVGIWGHSMGGGITIRVVTISDQIKVAALYGSLNSDDEVHYCWLNTCRVPSAPTRLPRVPELSEADPDFVPNSQSAGQVSATVAPAPFFKLHEIFLKSSPSRYLQYFTAPVIIHHGEADDTVPIQWSVDLADTLNAMGKQATLYTYPGEGHVFAGWSWQLFMARTLRFFDERLNPRETPVTAERRVLRQERNLWDSGY